MVTGYLTIVSLSDPPAIGSEAAPTATTTWLARSIAIVRRHPWRASLGIRFAYGLRIALPIACGVAHLPLMKYAIGTAVSSVVWSLVFTVLGWWLGRTTETFLGHVRQLESLIGGIIVLVVLVVFIVLRRRHVAERTAHMLDPER